MFLHGLLKSNRYLKHAAFSSYLIWTLTMFQVAQNGINAFPHEAQSNSGVLTASPWTLSNCIFNCAYFVFYSGEEDSWLLLYYSQKDLWLSKIKNKCFWKYRHNIFHEKEILNKVLCGNKEKGVINYANYNWGNVHTPGDITLSFWDDTIFSKIELGNLMPNNLFLLLCYIKFIPPLIF